MASNRHDLRALGAFFIKAIEIVYASLVENGSAGSAKAAGRGNSVVPSRGVAGSTPLELVFISIAAYGVASAEENFVTEQLKQMNPGRKVHAASHCLESNLSLVIGSTLAKHQF